MGEEGFDFEVSPALNAAIAMHEMFETLIQAGFDEKQALYLVAEMLRGASNG